MRYQLLINKLLVLFYIIAVSLLIVGWPASFFDHMRPTPQPETQPPPPAPAISQQAPAEPAPDVDQAADELLIEEEGRLQEGAENGTQPAPADEEQDEPEESSPDEEPTAPPAEPETN